MEMKNLIASFLHMKTYKFLECFSLLLVNTSNAQEGTCNQKSWADQALPSSPATLITSLYVHLSHLSVPSQTPWMPGQKCKTNDGQHKKHLLKVFY
jgi:hypothetical protein